MAFLGADSAYIKGQNVQESRGGNSNSKRMTQARSSAAERFDWVRIEPFPVVSPWELTAANNRVHI